MATLANALRQEMEAVLSSIDTGKESIEDIACICEGITLFARNYVDEALADMEKKVTMAGEALNQAAENNQLDDPALTEHIKVMRDLRAAAGVMQRFKERVEKMFDEFKRREFGDDAD